MVTEAPRTDDEENVAEKQLILFSDLPRCTSSVILSSLFSERLVMQKFFEFTVRITVMAEDYQKAYDIVEGVIDENVSNSDTLQNYYIDPDAVKLLQIK